MPDIYPERNVGQLVGQIGSVNLLRRQPGVPMEVSTSLLHSGLLLDQEDELFKRYDAMLKKIDAMPQASFTEFAETVSRLNDRGYMLDSASGSNVLIDVKQKRFNPVDIGKGAERNTVSNLVRIFAQFEACVIFCEWDDLDFAHMRAIWRRTTRIIEKCYVAAYAAGMPYKAPEMIADEYTVEFEAYYGEVDSPEYERFRSVLCAAKTPAGYGPRSHDEHDHTVLSAV